MQAPRKWFRGIGSTQTRWAPPDEEWLRYQYLVLGKSCDLIAREIGVGCGSTVRSWLRAAEIPIRSKQQALTLRGGENSPHWTGGDFSTHSRWARRILDTAGIPMVCARCGTSPGRNYLIVHHKDFDVKNTVLENLERLCRSCHRRIHSGWPSRLTEFEAYGVERRVR